jgi:hypothetical protein
MYPNKKEIYLKDNLVCDLKEIALNKYVACDYNDSCLVIIDRQRK